MYDTLNTVFLILIACMTARFFVLLFTKRKNEALFTVISIAVLYLLYLILTYEHDRMIFMLSGCLYIGAYFIFRFIYYVSTKTERQAPLVLMAVGYGVILIFVFLVFEPPVLDMWHYSNLTEAKEKIGSEVLIPEYTPRYVDPDENTLYYESYQANPIEWNTFAFIPPDIGLRNIDTFKMHLANHDFQLSSKKLIYDYEYRVVWDTLYMDLDISITKENATTYTIPINYNYFDSYNTNINGVDSNILVYWATSDDEKYPDFSDLFYQVTSKIEYQDKYHFITISLKQVYAKNVDVNSMIAAGEKYVIPEIEKVLQSLQSQMESSDMALKGEQ